MTHADRISIERHIAAILATALLVPLIAVAGTALHVPLATAILAAAVLAAIAWPPVARRLPRALDDLRRSHAFVCVSWFTLGLIAVVREYGVALFMADAEHAQASALWFDGFYIRHSCLSAYWKAAELARAGVDNLYDVVHYEGTEGRFKLDEYLYPPQFLILPLAFIGLGAGFLELRAAWFVFELAMLLAAMFAASRWIGGASGLRAALLIPAVLVATPVLLTLQLGNFQIAAIAMSVLAMLAFERGRAVAGGALLGFAVFKIFPLLLGVYLLIHRRWRALAWTIACCALYTAVAYGVLGAQPFHAFFDYQLPRIANGEAWSWLGNEGMEAVVAINGSVTGSLLKLRQLGLEVDGYHGALSWAWTLTVAALTVFVARRAPRLSRRERVACWIALLGLAALRSPFVPDAYALFPAVWLWSLVAAGAAMRVRTLIALAALWLVLATVMPFSGMPLPDTTARLVVSTVSQVAAIGLSLWTILRAPSTRADADARERTRAAHLPA